MPFPPPTHGHVERPIGETAHEHLLPTNNVKPHLVKEPLLIKDIDVGDCVTIEFGRNPLKTCVAWLQLDGERFLGCLYYRRGKWFVQTDTREGVAPEGLICEGVVRDLIKNQLD